MCLYPQAWWWGAPLLLQRRRHRMGTPTAKASLLPSDLRSRIVLYVQGEKETLNGVLLLQRMSAVLSSSRPFVRNSRNSWVAVIWSD